MDAIRAVAEPTEADLERARAVVAAHLRPTPVVELELPDGHGTVLAKLECLQPTGSFKVRGALAALATLAALRRLGARLVEHGGGYEQAERHALRLAADGAVYVSAYNDPQVIAGQATWAWELAGQVPGEVTLVVPAGGGGLLAGTALWAAGREGVSVVGVEAAASRALSAAVRAGRIVEVPV